MLGEPGCRAGLAHLAGELDEYLDILPGGMENLGHALVCKQLEQRLQIDADCQRVDEYSLVGSRGLHQAKLRPEVVSRRNSVSTVTKSCFPARSQNSASTAVEVISSMNLFFLAP